MHLSLNAGSTLPHPVKNIYRIATILLGTGTTTDSKKKKKDTFYFKEIDTMLEFFLFRKMIL